MTSVTEPSNVIYGLHDGDGVIRYVGLTTKTARNRLRSHRGAARQGGEYPVNRWMRKHGPSSIKSVVLEVVPLDGNLPAAEIRWIAHYRAASDGLLNVTVGGDCFSALFWDQAQRDKQAARRSGTVATEQTRAKMSAAHTGLKVTAETRLKMSKSGKVTAQSPARLEAARRVREGLAESSASKITAADALAIRLERATSGATYKSIGKPYGLSSEAVSMICRRITWQHVA